MRKFAVGLMALVVASAITCEAANAGPARLRSSASLFPPAVFLSPAVLLPPAVLRESHVFQFFPPGDFPAGVCSLLPGLLPALLRTL
jgi:hypothetical protein